MWCCWHLNFDFSSSPERGAFWKIHIYYDNERNIDNNDDDADDADDAADRQGYNKTFALLFRNAFFFSLLLFISLLKLLVHCLFHCILFVCVCGKYNISVDKPSVYPIVKKMKKFLVFVCYDIIYCLQKAYSHCWHCKHQ